MDNRRVGIIAAACAASFFVGRFSVRGEWKPTGDSRTIVNTASGEVRMMATGEEITAFRKRIDAERAQEAANKTPMGTMTAEEFAQYRGKESTSISDKWWEKDQIVQPDQKKD